MDACHFAITTDSNRAGNAMAQGSGRNVSAVVYTMVLMIFSKLLSKQWLSFVVYTMVSMLFSTLTQPRKRHQSKPRKNRHAGIPSNRQ